MNRKARRAASKQTMTGACVAAVPTADTLTHAEGLYRAGALAKAEELCLGVLAREPAHIRCLNLLGSIAQTGGQHRRAVNYWGKALEVEPRDGVLWCNAARSYEALNQKQKARHAFKQAIAAAWFEMDFVALALGAPAIAGPVKRLEDAWPARPPPQAIFGPSGLSAIARDALLLSLLESVPLADMAIEALLTAARTFLLRLANDGKNVGDEIVEFAAALAQQCFLNEYVFTQGADELSMLDRLSAALSSCETGVIPFRLAVLACYRPLSTAPDIDSLPQRQWPDPIQALFRQQVTEPRQEAQDSAAVPAVTSVDEASLAVMRQYEESPYPRWAIEKPWHGGARTASPLGILVAGCGTGSHVIQVARQFPNARILAVDLSKASLAYAQRKARELGLGTIEFAQADILNLREIGRSFDRIESVGVLHHLADPGAGLDVLAALLRPDGEMRIGLYSKLARRHIIEAREFIHERGYSARAEDIRRFRQDVLAGDYRGRWRQLAICPDFYSMSGCRDLVFNVQEHQFAVAELKSLLAQRGLVFDGFDIRRTVIDAFRRRFSATDALLDLNAWAAFEADNPDVFRSMYVFVVRKQPLA
jgi:2-polyprenyl-3-methyl-5-hydroxy-6-metoxy-1,4-benzoquinol methylase